MEGMSAPLWIGIKMCVCVSKGIVVSVHRGLGEALQCIILLHLLYSSSPHNTERQRRGCSVGTADTTAVALLSNHLGWWCCSQMLTLMCRR